MDNDYEVLKDIEELDSKILINKDYNMVKVALGYRGITLDFKLIEFIVLMASLADAVSCLETDRINVTSELEKLDKELKKAVTLVREEIK